MVAVVVVVVIVGRERGRSNCRSSAGHRLVGNIWKKGGEKRFPPGLLQASIGQARRMQVRQWPETRLFMASDGKQLPSRISLAVNKEQARRTAHRLFLESLGSILAADIA